VSGARKKGKEAGKKKKKAADGGVVKALSLGETGGGGGDGGEEGGMGEVEGDGEEGEEEECEEEEEEEGESDFEEDENDKEIVPSEFVEALVRLAAARYTRSGTLAERLEKLIENNLRPVLGKVMDTTTFRSRMTGKLVQTFLSKKKRSLKDLFVFYAGKDQTDKGVATTDSIDIGECTTFCRDFDLGVPDRVIGRLFACAQSDEDDGKEDTSMLDEKSELSYDEFLELLGALACWRSPDPYEPMLKKVSVFVKEVLQKHEDLNCVGTSKRRRGKN
jgi:hypothetical protein